MAPQPNGTIFIATKRSILVSLLIIGLLPYGLTLLSQEIQHDVSVINIGRRLQGSWFV
jgi:hypothetical protein